MTQDIKRDAAAQSLLRAHAKDGAMLDSSRRAIDESRRILSTVSRDRPDKDSPGALQRATRNYERVQTLVDDQEKRVSALRAEGNEPAEHAAAALLSIYQTTLETYRQRLELERRKHGLPPA